MKEEKLSKVDLDYLKEIDLERQRRFAKRYKYEDSYEIGATFFSCKECGAPLKNPRINAKCYSCKDRI